MVRTLENDTIVERNLSMSHLVLTLISSLLIGFGLSGNDVFLNIAVSGPLIIIGLSGIPLLFAIESRHTISHKIDNTLSEAPGLGFLQDNMFIQLLFFFSCVILLLLSILFLSERDYFVFSLALFLSCCILGVVVGRSFGKNIGETSKSDTWNNLDDSAKYEEFLDFKKWLSGDLRENLSSLQSRKIEEQKLNFFKETLKITSDTILMQKLMTELKMTIKEPGKIVNNITEKLFVNIYKNSYNNWLDDVMKFNDKKKDIHVRESIQALLLLPSLFELIHMLSRKGGARDGFVLNQLLTCAGVFASRLQVLDMVIQGSDNVSNDAIFVEDIDESIQLFVNFVSIKACQFEKYDFSPWWLLNFRSLLLSMKGSHKDELSQRVAARLNLVNSYQEDWCFSLSEYFSGNVDMERSLSTSAELISQIKEERSGIFEFELVRLTWQSYESSR